MANDPEHIKYHYDYIAIDRLHLPERLGLYDKTISTRLHSAYQVIKESGKDYFGQSDIFGMNRCVHLASSIVLLCTDSEKLAPLIEEIKVAVDEDSSEEVYEGPDPTTVITIAALYYILIEYSATKKLADGSEILSAQERVEICRHFENVNWMIGLKAVKLLGIENG